MKWTKTHIFEAIAILVLMLSGGALLLNFVSNDLTDALPNSFVKVVAIGLLLGGLTALVSLFVRGTSVASVIVHSGGLFLQLWVTVALGLASLLILPDQSWAPVIVAFSTLAFHGWRLHQLSLVTREVPLLSMLAPLQSVVDELDVKMVVLVSQTANGLRYTPTTALGSSAA